MNRNAYSANVPLRQFLVLNITNGRKFGKSVYVSQLEPNTNSPIQCFSQNFIVTNPWKELYIRQVVQRTRNKVFYYVVKLWWSSSPGSWLICIFVHPRLQRLFHELNPAVILLAELLIEYYVNGVWTTD